MATIVAPAQVPIVGLGVDRSGMIRVPAETVLAVAARVVRRFGAGHGIHEIRSAARTERVGHGRSAKTLEVVIANDREMGLADPIAMIGVGGGATRAAEVADFVRVELSQEVAAGGRRPIPARAALRVKLVAMNGEDLVAMNGEDLLAETPVDRTPGQSRRAAPVRAVVRRHRDRSTSLSTSAMG